MAFNWDEQYKKEWRELGFYYEYSDELNSWIITTSLNGLTNLVEIILNYTGNPDNNEISEHCHIGPHAYFKIITWYNAEIKKDGIYGTIKDLEKLAGLIRRYSNGEVPTNSVVIDKEYSDRNTATLKLVIINDPEFDPSALDLSKRYRQSN